MKRVVIVGNSGSGKSSLAREIEAKWNVPMLELDDLVWVKGEVGVLRPLEEVIEDLDQFLSENRDWVVEGCYGELARRCLAHGAELIWLNPGVEVCVANNLNRSWEPHKYASKEEQDAQLENLLEWVRSYPTRDDDWSEAAHLKLYEEHPGRKRELLTSGEFWTLSS